MEIGGWGLGTVGVLKFGEGYYKIGGKKVDWDEIGGWD